MPKRNQMGQSARFIIGRGGGRGGFHRDDGSGSRRFRQESTFRGYGGGIQKRRIFPSRDNEGDVIMDGNVQYYSGSHRKHSRGRDFKGRKGNRMGNKFSHNFGPGWHKVIIFGASSLNKDFILNGLTNASRESFLPVAYTILPPNAVFFVDNRTAAESVAECSGRVTAPDSNPINLKVVAVGTPPTPEFNDTLLTRMRGCLERRFNAINNILSLEAFYKSPELIGDYYLPLVRPSVCHKIFAIIEPKLAELRALDMSNNKLSNLDGFSCLPSKAKSLKSLSLKNNNLKDFTILDKIKGLQIEEVVLDGNPLCDRYDDKEKYIREVRRRFPKILRLDGVEVPPQISFESEEPLKLPDIKGSSYCNEQAKGVVLKFWTEYLKIYDSDDRSPLINAYHDAATMSMMTANSYGHISSQDPSRKLSIYLEDSRNLKRIKDRSRALKLLNQGKGNIIKLLKNLPKTLHDMNSICIDMPVAVEKFVMFTVSGIFKEREERHKSVRYFSRTFTIIPQNQGFCIVNELYHITNASTDQIKGSFQQPAPTPSPSPVPYVQGVAACEPGPSSAVVPPLNPVSLTEEQKIELISQFAMQSGMNQQGSRTCLEQNNWDFNRSAQVFLDLKNQNKIPAEYFIK